MKRIAVACIYAILTFLYYGIHPRSSVLYACLFLVLFLQSIEDIRFLQISDKHMIALAFISLLLCREERVPFTAALSGSLFISSILYGLYKITNGKAIGGADVRFLFLTGSFLGLYHSVRCLLYACLCALLYSLKTAGKEKEIPFIPFLSLGVYLVLLLK